jgi:hypothetical protein
MKRACSLQQNNSAEYSASIHGHVILHVKPCSIPENVAAKTNPMPIPYASPP